MSWTRSDATSSCLMTLQVLERSRWFPVVPKIPYAVNTVNHVTTETTTATLTHQAMVNVAHSHTTSQVVIQLKAHITQNMLRFLEYSQLWSHVSRAFYSQNGKQASLMWKSHKLNCFSFTKFKASIEFLKFSTAFVPALWFNQTYCKVNLYTQDASNERFLKSLIFFKESLPFSHMKGARLEEGINSQSNETVFFSLFLNFFLFY